MKKFVTCLQLLSVTGIMAIGHYAFGQETYGNDDVWLLWINQVHINDQWSAACELHLRYDNGLQDRQQWLIRPSVNYHVSNKVTLTVGYSFIQTYPYGKYPLASRKSEHNVWEQISLKQMLGMLTIRHRYRLEQRLQSTYNSIEKKYDFNDIETTHRFRYRLLLKYPIGKSGFVQVYDELWIRTDEYLPNVSMDRNWIYAGLGKKFGRSIILQAGYLHQNISVSKARYERHPTFQLTVQYLLSLNR